MEIRNAIINNATLEIDDHGVLTVWLYLNYGGSGQGFGGYALYLPDGFKHHNIWGVAGHFIYRILQIADVKNWDQLQGKTIRVKQDDRSVYAIGHIVKDDWFCPKEDFENLDCNDVANGKKEFGYE